MVIPSSDPDGKRAKQARQWRSARMERFAQTQRRERNWINVEEIGELCSELDGSGVPNEAARENAYRNFECALLHREYSLFMGFQEGSIDPGQVNISIPVQNKFIW